MLKFRTLTVAAPHHVTRSGRWLRPYALDELPQLFNVLRGELSLVGPRPPLPDDAARASAVWQRVLTVTPGVAGPGQLLRQMGQRADVEQAENLAYVAQRSLRGDLGILGRTVLQLLGRR
jgi:lipopolysaccharide/colanic/teichoic acid biosynthesis glycosyltransferase